MAVRSASEAWGAGRVDIDKIEATTEAQIRTQMIEDGDNPDAPFLDYRLKGSPEPKAARDLSAREKHVLRAEAKRVRFRRPKPDEPAPVKPRKWA